MTVEIHALLRQFRSVVPLPASARTFPRNRGRWCPTAGWTPDRAVRRKRTDFPLGWNTARKPAARQAATAAGVPATSDSHQPAFLEAAGSRVPRCRSMVATVRVSSGPECRARTSYRGRKGARLSGGRTTEQRSADKSSTSIVSGRSNPWRDREAGTGSASTPFAPFGWRTCPGAPEPQRRGIRPRPTRKRPASPDGVAPPVAEV